MFLNVFSKQLKIGFRNKQNIFWTLMFPVILGTLFYVAFGSLFKSFVSEPIKTAVVSESSNKELENTIVDFLASIEMKDMKILDIVDPTDDPDKLLKDEKVNGIIYIEDNGRLRLKAKSNGNQTTIQESIITAYNQSADLVERVAAEHPERLEEVLKSISSRVDYINAKDMAGKNKDPYLSYFYNLIAMTALFASLNSLRIGNNCQANMSSLGARTNASPLRRVMFQLAGFLAAYIVQTFVLCIGLGYLIFILKIKFGGDILMIYGATALAGLLGTALGFMVGNIGNMTVEKRESILVAVTLGSCALSGLMVGDIKAVIAEKAPFINRINPAAVISDSFYSLNIFGTGRRFMECILYMAILSIVFIAAGLIMGRRQSYDSI